MKKKPIKIIAISGIRSEYELMARLYQTISQNEQFHLELIITGAHLSAKFGYTIEQIRRDGLLIAGEINNLQERNEHTDRLTGVGKLLLGLATILSAHKPDFLFLVGDREEALAGAVAGAYLHIPIIHIGGGDTCYGNVDDSVRHAITKLASIHLTMSEESKKNILRMGEEPFRVYTVGDPGLDRLRLTVKISRASLERSLGIHPQSKPLLLLIQHPLSSESADAYKQMKITLHAVRMLEFETVIIYPNSDPGSEGIIRAIMEDTPSMSFVRIFKNLHSDKLVNLLRYTDCLIGNSSMGILEAGFFYLPVVNIGNRQKGRVIGKNVVFVGHNENQIIEAVRRACFDESYKKALQKAIHPYGDGRSIPRIMKILSELNPDDPQLTIKKFV